MATRSPSDSEIAIWPALSFWFGLSPDDLYRLERPILMEYVRQLGSLIAEYQLINIQAAIVPNMKDSDRKKLIKDLTKSADSRYAKTERRVSKQEYEDRLAALGVPLIPETKEDH